MAPTALTVGAIAFFGVGFFIIATLSRDRVVDEVVERCARRFSFQALLPFSGGVCADVAAASEFVGRKSTAANLLVCRGAAYFKVSQELGNSECLLRHIQPFLGYWPSVFAAICGKHLGHEQDFKKNDSS